MITWESEDLRYKRYEFVRGTGNGGRWYSKITFQDVQTKRDVCVYDFSGINNAAKTFEHITTEKPNTRWYLAGVVNTAGAKHFLVLQSLALVVGDKLMDPWRNEEGISEIELGGGWCKKGKGLRSLLNQKNTTVEPT